MYMHLLACECDNNHFIAAVKIAYGMNDMLADTYDTPTPAREGGAETIKRSLC